MKWRKEGQYLAVSDAGYKVAKFIIGDKVVYRPSLSGEFISFPVDDPKEAQAICQRHQQIMGGA
jgi:hypothetical protein